ncbi:MAG: L,D-transpeptidase [Candidatus Saccharimonadales bacterium]
MSTDSVHDVVLPNQPRLQTVALGPNPAPSVEHMAALSIVSAQAASSPEIFSSPETSDQHTPASRPPTSKTNFLRHHTLAIFAILFLIIGIAGIKIGGRYWSAAYIAKHTKPAIALKATSHSIAGLNAAIADKQLQDKLQTITSQPATLTVGTQTVPVSADTIKSWLQITPNAAKTEDSIHVSADTIAASLTQLAGKYVKTPANQVTVNEDGVNRVVVAGHDGTTLSDPTTLKTQAQQVAKTVMDAKGLQFSTPIQTAPFQSVTTAALGKVLVADVTTKKMWAFQNGQQVNSWLVSAGKPSTPTPLGEFHVYAKYAVQDMRGTNPDGTPYFQPHVHWVNYFSGGSAVHGVYWHPLSWFGVNNSSHGCIGVPDSQAAWIYNWAAIGTTVIVHA